MAGYKYSACPSGLRLIEGFIVATLAAFLAASPAQAILIDNFNTGTLVITDSGFSTVDGVGIIGGERDMVTGANITGEFSTNKAGNGRLIIDFTSGPVAADAYTISYDGNDDTTAHDFTGLNGADFTDGGSSDSIRVRLLDTSVPLSIWITVSQQVGGDNWFLDQLITVGPVASPTDVFFLFDDFDLACSFCGTASFSSIDWMKITFFRDTPGAAPFEANIDFIQTQDAGPAGRREIPEPPMIPLLASALAGLGFASWRAKTKSRSS